jgi:hypothetical protein
MLQTDNIAVGAPSATDSATRPVIEKFEMTHVYRELSEIRMAIAQLTTKSDLLHTMNKAVEKILSNLQMATTKFGKQKHFLFENMRKCCMQQNDS